MEIKIFTDADELAVEAARFVAKYARECISEYGSFNWAVSGGRTPWLMLRDLAKEEVDWKRVHIFQVDERIAPEGHPDRNLTHLLAVLLENTPINEKNIHPMRVESDDAGDASAAYADELSTFCGAPPVFDLIHLGLGVDGHTASLIPDDPVLNVIDCDVAVCDLYQGRKRMTLTYRVINRARKILWVVSGSDKASMLKRLIDADWSIPAGCVNRENAYILADSDAASSIS